ncbi:unnamed protein product [Bursaphelenchus xylophilus]|uniref:(pine wood nematode) hypothetical protein n=1 Tax=Bursaphelenchus xylophilus TaxID=6326 RepID=A0A1I7RQ10_BURXY|nr:unnamed protein product [Bursaphelenchus xylophilus]CAG9096954.1 unnamed protein product [Bursaphelenchus xylophilus]
MLKVLLWMYLSGVVLGSWDGPVVTIEKEEKIPTIEENHDDLEQIHQNRIDSPETREAAGDQMNGGIRSRLVLGTAMIIPVLFMYI